MSAAAAAKPAQLAGVHKPGERSPNGFGLCIYGVGGVGKTTLLGTMPGRGLIVDVPQIEGGTLVLEGVKDRIDVKPIESWDDIDDVYWFLSKQIPSPTSYQWVGIDSITAMSELAKRKVIKERPLDSDPHQITQQDWGKIGQLVSELIYKFRTLPIHTLWVAQERKFDGATEQGPGKLGPAVSPMALGALLPSMLLVGRLSTEYAADGTLERQFMLGSHPSYYTKVRARPGLDVPRVCRNPNLAIILKYLLGSGPRPEEVQAPAAGSIFFS